MTKKGSSFPYTWRRRYFVLRIDGTLKYYVSTADASHEVNAAGEAKIVKVKATVSETHGLIFEQDSSLKPALLARAPSATEQKRWIRAIEPPSDTIYVKTPEGTVLTFTVNVSGTSTQKLKEQVSLSVGVPPERQRLHVEGRVLDDELLLSASGVGSSATLQLEVLPEPGAVRGAHHDTVSLLDGNSLQLCARCCKKTAWKSEKHPVSL